MSSLNIDGRFFSHHGERITLRGVTLGPLPPEHDLTAELARIADLGANMVRLYEPPTTELLDEAKRLSIHVFASVPWPWATDFLANPSTIEQAYSETRTFLREHADHPALAGIYIANEIPVDLVRWMGIPQVKDTLETLINRLRHEFPDVLYAYANFPTTEFLELSNADFTAFNLYLEDEENLRSYLQHLHVIAGARPLVISEFGVDAGTLSPHGEEGQERILNMASRVMTEVGVMGATYFAWSDLWWKGDRLVPDWKFGLQRADNTLRPVAHSLFRPEAQDLPECLFSVIVCTYNGEDRMGPCLQSLIQIEDSNYEVIVINDGSLDSSAAKSESFTSAFVERGIPFRVISQANEGLSHARNTGAQHAKGELLAYTDDDARPDREWLTWLRAGFADSTVGMCGGYGIPPTQTVGEAHEVANLPGQACPVLLSSTVAEHLPGCNMAVRKSVWQEIVGFSDRYRVAGDDVDFCWRVMAAGYTLLFTPNAYVWHESRPTYLAYLKQQWGYGKAEALLATDHPDRVKPSGISWKGTVYEGDSVGYQQGCEVYAGLAGLAPFQPLQARSETRQTPESKLGQLLARYYPLVRMAARWKYGRPPSLKSVMNLISLPRLSSKDAVPTVKARYWREESTSRQAILEHFVANGWSMVSDSPWDAKHKNSRLRLALEEPDNNGVTLLLETNALAEVSDVLDELGWTKL